MAEQVIMPKDDWQAALDATRAKGGTSALMTSAELASAIEAIQTGGGMNLPIKHGTITAASNGYMTAFVYGEMGPIVSRPSYANGLLIARVNTELPAPTGQGCNELITFYTPTQQFDFVAGSFNGGVQSTYRVSPKTMDAFWNGNLGSVRNGYVGTGQKITVEEYELPAQLAELVFTFREVFA